MVEFRLLGPFEVLCAGEPVDVGAGRQRGLLALLAIHAGSVLSADRIADELWAGAPPVSAANAIQVYISGLRKILEPGLVRAADAEVLVTRRPGYMLLVDDARIDARRFEALAAQGRRDLSEGRAVAAADALRQGLGLWRGPALDDLADDPFAKVEATRLDEHRLAALEDRVAADLAGSVVSSAELAAELEGLVALHPLRERLWAGLMLALYRSGRQADALRAYQRARQTLAEELGLEPGPELRRMEAAILDHAPELVPRDVAVAVPVERAEATEPAISAGRTPRGFREERKVVTALFADLVGSTPLGEQLEPEEYRLVVEDAVARMVAAATDLGGFVVTVAGDGLLALFGAPVAHEDDPERALRAGLRIVEAIAEYASEVSRAWGVGGLAVRVGVNTGPAALGPIGGGAVVDYTGLGDAVNTAARLESAARPGSVLVSEATARLVAPLFDWGAVESLTLKGKAGAVDAVEVLRVRTDPGRVRGVEGMEADFIGRDRELAEATELVDEVLAGRGGVLLLTGEPGIGKTRLLGELKSRLERASSPGGAPRWFQGRCTSYGDTLRYWPVQSLVRDWLGVTADHPEVRVRIALRRHLAALFGSEPEEVLAAFVTLLGLAPNRDLPAIEQPRPEAVQRAMGHAVRQVVERLGHDGPVVLAVEDLHWADPDSLRLIEQLLPITDDAPVLVVLTGRPERDHAWWRLAEVAQREMAHRTRSVVLDALTPEADGALLAALVGEGTLPASVERRVLDAAEGNPFFLEELLRSLVDAGALVRAEDGWRYVHEIALDVPETVEKVIVARVDRLGPDAHAVLASAAVLGREFGLPLLEAVVPDVDVRDALRELQRLGLVRESGRWPIATYRFRHALIQEAVYRSLLRERRRELHRAAASALERHVVDALDEHAATLAWHFDEAGDGLHAAAYHQKAADVARGTSAPAAAREHYRRALDLGEDLGWDQHDRRRVELLFGLAVTALQLGDAVRADAEWQRAFELARAGAHSDLEAQLVHTLIDLAPPLGRDFDHLVPPVEAAIEEARRRGDTALEVALLAKMGMHWANHLRFDEGAEWTHKALALARTTGDEGVVASALDGCKMVACYLGQVDRLSSVATELQEILRRQGDLWYLQWAVAEGAVAPMAAGRWDAAAAQLQAARELNRRIGDRGQSSYILAHLAWVHRARGEYGRALDIGREAVASAKELGHTWWLSWTEAVHSWTLLDVRAGAEALEELQSGLAAAEAAGTGNYLVRCLGQAAWAHVLAGHPDEAATALSRAQEVMGTVRTPPGAVFLHAAHGYVAAARAALALGQPECGARLLKPIVDAAAAEGWKEMEAYGALVLGRCTGEEALLRRALAVADEAGVRGAAWEAHAALGHGVEANALIRELSVTLHDDRLRARFVAAATEEVG